MDVHLPNHSFVYLTLVGNAEDGSDSVKCHTDLRTCCSAVQGPDRGDWHAPGSHERLPFADDHSHDIYEVRRNQQVYLRRRNNGGKSGIYRCIVETNAVNNDDGREFVYVGLYVSGGEYISTIHTI